MNNGKTSIPNNQPSGGGTLPESGQKQGGQFAGIHLPLGSDPPGGVRLPERRPIKGGQFAGMLTPISSDPLRGQIPGTGGQFEMERGVSLARNTHQAK
jgi:hypothetical protein